jgi:hypothetical protein
VTAVAALAVSTVLIGRQQRQATRALQELRRARVEQLRTATPQAVPDILAELADHRLHALGVWADALRPARHSLHGPLVRAFRSGELPARRLLAARILADYAGDSPDALVELLPDADEPQFAVLLPRLRPHRARAVALLGQELGKRPPPNDPPAAREALARREQFLRFRKDHAYRLEYAPAPDGPVIDVSWYDAAAYCNWLSEQEGIPRKQWCYPEKAGPGMRLPEDYLRRTGYRLPTEAEWECASRAGAGTSRFYGTPPALLGGYAWFAASEGDQGVRPVGRLRPNDWGLFDVYGNVAEWCQSRHPGPQSPVAVDREGPDAVVRAGAERTYRGGGFFNPASSMRSACRMFNRPDFHNYHVGFRPARTVR